jgi:enoyl-CoA hydratase
MELALTGDFIDSARAYQTGLVNHVVEDGKALETAIEMAEKICENGPLAVAASKKIVNSARDWSNDEMFQKEKVLSTPILTSEDAIEGATAFAEKRAPQWKGK